MKVMIILVYDSQGILECHAVREGCTVNAANYRLFLQYNLHCTLRRKRPALLSNAIILHDNATSHTTACVHNLLQRWAWKILQHPQYSPDCSTCNFDLIPKLKTLIRGKRFAKVHVAAQYKNNSRDSFGFSVVSILSAQVVRSCVVPLLLTRRFCIQTML